MGTRHQRQTRRTPELLYWLCSVAPPLTAPRHHGDPSLPDATPRWHPSQKPACLPCALLSTADISSCRYPVPLLQLDTLTHLLLSKWFYCSHSLGLGIEASSSLLYYNVTLSNFPIQTCPIKVVLSLNSSVSLSASSVQCPTLSSLSGPQEVRGCLSSAHSSLQTLRRQLAEAESAKREAEQRSRTLQGERDGFQIEKDTTQRERERLKQDRDTLARYNQESPQADL